MKKRLRYIAFRATPEQAQKLSLLAASADGNLSEALRNLVDSLEFEQHTVLRPVARLDKLAKGKEVQYA